MSSPPQPGTAQPPWVKTPLVESVTLSRIAGCKVYLKLDNLQPSGSFKSRGVGNYMRQRVLENPPNTPIHFYCSSGGNAGLACVTAANLLTRPSTIVVPLPTPPSIVTSLRLLGATVHVHGSTWAESDAYLHSSLLSADPHGIYVPPFDHPDVWAGNATVVDEVLDQLPPSAASSAWPLDAIICSVGGGGLLNGIVQGLDAHAASRPASSGSALPTVLAMETFGADSLSQSIKAGKLVTLPGITSIARSLGAVRVAERTLQCGQRPHVKSEVLEDAVAARAAVRFAGDERLIVEAACAVSLAPVYAGREALGRALGKTITADSRVVVVVCGGSHVSLDVLEGYKRKYGEGHVEVEAASRGGKDLNGVPDPSGHVDLENEGVRSMI